MIFVKFYPSMGHIMVSLNMGNGSLYSDRIQPSQRNGMYTYMVHLPKYKS